MNASNIYLRTHTYNSNLGVIEPATRLQLGFLADAPRMNPDSADVLPVFDIGSVLGKHPESYSAEDFALCKGVAECLHQTGCLIVSCIGSENSACGKRALFALGGVWGLKESGQAI